MGKKLGALATAALALALLALAGCGGRTRSPSSPACFVPDPNSSYLNRNAIFVASAGSSSISAFQNPGPNYPVGTDPVCGSPFPVASPPTALAEGDSFLVVLSAPARTISIFQVDFLTSALKGPTVSITSPRTPVAADTTFEGNDTWIYVADAEGGVSAYYAPAQPHGPPSSIAEIPGSPFPTGSAPSAVRAFPPSLYVANSGSNDISAYSLDPATGALTPVPGSPFPTGTDPSSIAAVPASPFVSGSIPFLVVANRGSNNVSVYSVASDGGLTPVPGSPFEAGQAPSSVVVDAYGSFVYVADSGSNDISAYAIDPATGNLTRLAGSPFAVGGTQPVSLSGYLYVANAGSNNLSVFREHQYPSDGTLIQVAGSPFPVGTSPRAVLYFVVPQ